MLVVVLVAAGLRLVRALSRWDEIALAYAAYQQPWVDSIGSPSGMLGTFVGLHPPAYSALYSLLDWSWGAPMAWLLTSALLSTAAVWLVGRVGGIGAALCLCFDPLQLAYAAEVNNYPLMVFAIALCLHERERVRADGRWLGLALAGALAGWTHLLAGAVAGLIALTLVQTDRRATLRVLGLMAVLCLPVIARAAVLGSGEDTYGQSGLDLATVWTGLSEKSGWWVIAWLVAGLSLRRWRLSVVLWLTAAAILGLIALGVSASHQQPYWLALGPLAALAPRRAIAAAFALFGLYWCIGHTLQPAWRLGQSLERPRAIDTALASDAEALWLLAPALMPDDDKTMDSDVLWRFGPFSRMEPWRGPRPGSFEYTDYRFGQPRVMNGRIVHTSTSLDPAVVDLVVGWHLDAGREVVFVLYDHGPANDYPGMLRGALKPWDATCIQVGEDVGLGTDLLCEVAP
ncbi:MAG TPA: hypothetical protein QGF58_29765 [Myxococcota bacterium]|nr:hypothetical protein [Myxococcota bacterium]